MCLCVLVINSFVAVPSVCRDLQLSFGRAGVTFFLWRLCLLFELSVCLSVATTC